VTSRIEHLHKSKQGYSVPDNYNLGWMMFAISDGDIIKQRIIENEYTTLETLKLMYFKQVKTLKELEGMKN